MNQILGMGGEPDPRLREAFEALADHPDPWIREVAARALRYLRE